MNVTILTPQNIAQTKGLTVLPINGSFKSPSTQSSVWSARRSKEPLVSACVKFLPQQKILLHFKPDHLLVNQYQCELFSHTDAAFIHRCQLSSFVALSIYKTVVHFLLILLIKLLQRAGRVSAELRKYLMKNIWTRRTWSLLTHKKIISLYQLIILNYLLMKGLYFLYTQEGVTTISFVVMF